MAPPCRATTSTRSSPGRASRATPLIVSRTTPWPFGKRVMTGASGPAADRKMDCRGIRAVHQPDARHELKQPHETPARFPGEKARGDFGQIDQREADENQHHRPIPGPEEHVDA